MASVFFLTVKLRAIILNALLSLVLKKVMLNVKFLAVILRAVLLIVMLSVMFLTVILKAVFLTTDCHIFLSCHAECHLSYRYIEGCITYCYTVCRIFEAGMLSIVF
jgi:hypothetical protein